jgi:hypothetical protein
MVADITSYVKTSIHKHLLQSFNDTSITDKSNEAQTSCYSMAEFSYSYQLNESVFILNPYISLLKTYILKEYNIHKHRL